ncbi:hypothetical protein FOCC_FOCC015906 [Frankliniella occidentalis]|nr:hypothetical protein FOCC_FOCC015906 [Frankliniella occidentalis]
MSYVKDRIKTNNNGIEDIYDGQCYLEAQRFFAGVEHWLTLLWNTDGFSVFKSSKYEIWPFYLSINELPPWLRFKKQFVLLGGLWFGAGKPDPNLFLKPLYDELCALKNGVLFKIAGLVEPLLYKIGMLAGTLDAPAKAVFLEANYLGDLDELRRLRENNENVRDVRGILGPTILKNMILTSLMPSTSVDIMHTLFQGVFKTLVMQLWFQESLNEDFNVSARNDVLANLKLSVVSTSF